MSALDDSEEPEVFADDILDEHDCETVCTICNAEFLDPQDLSQHLQQVHASESFETQSLIQCQFCTISLTDLEAYAIHIRDKHLRSLKMCSYCTKIFIEFDGLRKHERRHCCAKKGYISCSQCTETFTNNSDLERHEYEFHNNDKDGCMFQNFYPLLSTILNAKAVDFIHSMINNQDLECGKCGFMSSNIDLYVNHLQAQNCTSFSCDNCSYTPSSRKNLFRHMLRRKECRNFVHNKKRKCTECKEHITVQFYKRHVKECKPIKCLPCNKVFGTMEELSVHQNSNHPLAIEVKVCKFCSRQCVGAYALRKHMIRVHRHDIHKYKYKCVECDTPFKHPRKLFAHYFIKHKDLDPYTCKICDKKFRIRKRFTIHIKLDHKSTGFVEFDENYRVFFTEKKSENPFVPHCVIPEEELEMYTNMPSKDKKPKTDKTDKLDLDLLNQTETEANLTEIDNKPPEKVQQEAKRKVLKRKITKTKTTEDAIPVESSDDEDAPLVSLRKRKKTDKKLLQPPWARKKSIKDNRKQLTCNICSKYCYTYQNFQHHMSLHRKNDIKACIKCNEVFKSKEKLKNHIEKEHSSSKLTETLKSLLEKRKKIATTTLTATDKFQKTIKKSKVDNLNTPPAKITPVDNGLSVQKFIETFTPEGDTVKTPNVVIKNCVSIKKVTDPFFRKSTIKMTKFRPAEPLEHPRLTPPTKFTPFNSEPVKCTIKVVQNEVQDDFYTDHYDEGVEKAESIPEVAQEVMLEVTEEAPKIEATNKIVIPNLPKECKNLSIAHLQAEAPYYKIVKVKDVITEKKPEVPKKDLIRLPDGTHMITVNPLAHLLGEKKIEEILHPLKNKYYKPKLAQNLENLLTKALEKANTPTNVRKKKRAAKKLMATQSLNQTNDTE